MKSSCCWGAAWQTAIFPSSVCLELSGNESHKAGKGRELGSNTGETRNCLPMEISL